MNNFVLWFNTSRNASFLKLQDFCNIWQSWSPKQVQEEGGLKQSGFLLFYMGERGFKYTQKYRPPHKKLNPTAQKKPFFCRQIKKKFDCPWWMMCPNWTEYVKRAASSDPRIWKHRILAGHLNKRNWMTLSLKGCPKNLVLYQIKG